MSVLFRPHHFPPLNLVQADWSRRAEGLTSDIVASTQEEAQALAQAYEQAAQRGHDQGFTQGQADGERAGYESGHQAGLVAGHAQALDAARKELLRLGAPLSAVTEQLRLLHADWEASLRKDLIDLVQRVSRQVVRCELTLQPAQILALVEETLSGMSQRTGEIQVFLNPADLQRIQELDASRVPDWRLLPDSALEAGECCLRVGSEEVDAGCKQRLAACMEQVNKQLLSTESA